MASLQNEVSTKDFLPGTRFSREKCSEIDPEMLEPLFCGSKKFPQNVPPPKKKFTDEFLQERREKSIQDICVSILGTETIGFIMQLQLPYFLDFFLVRKRWERVGPQDRKMQQPSK